MKNVFDFSFFKTLVTQNYDLAFNPFSANPTKWQNTLIDHCVELALIGLTTVLPKASS